MKKDFYSYLSIVAMIAVPIAPAFYFGFDVAKDVYDKVFGWLQNPIVAGIFAGLIGLGAVAGLELVGILSGHNIVKYYSLGMHKIAGICGLILVAYVGLGIVGLENWLTKGVVMFLTAPLVYVLASMQQTAANIHTAQADNDQALLEFKLAEEAKDNELKRQLKAEKERAKMQPKTQPLTQPNSNHLPEVGNLEGNRLAVYQLYKRNPDATQQEIADAIGISRQMVSKYKKELNGYLS